MAVQMPKRLEIRTYKFAYTIPEDNVSGISKQADFLIDGESLGKILNIWPDRPWFGRTRFEFTRSIADIFVEELLGNKLPQNQFGTNRLVLFGCHCGSDYCGVISCEVVREENHILWKDIRWENDDDEDSTPTAPPVGSGATTCCRQIID